MQPILKIDFIITICSWDVLETASVPQIERFQIIVDQPKYYSPLWSLEGQHIIIIINFNSLKLNVERY